MKNKKLTNTDENNVDDMNHEYVIEFYRLQLHYFTNAFYSHRWLNKFHLRQLVKRSHLHHMINKLHLQQLTYHSLTFPYQYQLQSYHIIIVTIHRVTYHKNNHLHGSSLFVTITTKLQRISLVA